MKSSNLFITGCDSNTEWMLPWFVENFQKHMPNEELVIMDFGMEKSFFPEMRKSVRSNLNGWFQKPEAMLKATGLADNICWLDTDCEIRADISDIFNRIVPGKLSMAIDRPWTKRRAERGTWYNSGVVAFKDQPVMLTEWARYIKQGLTQEVGDQEVLNWMLGGDPLRELTHIEVLPRSYNFLRLDIQDGSPGLNTAKIVHWTGPKGKQHIRDLIDG